MQRKEVFVKINNKYYCLYVEPNTERYLSENVKFIIPWYFDTVNGEFKDKLTNRSVHISNIETFKDEIHNKQILTLAKVELISDQFILVPVWIEIF